MALLGRKKKKEVSKNEEKQVSSGVIPIDGNTQILLRPRITEKASERAANGNIYVFDVAMKATKRQIIRAIGVFYKVTPIKVATVAVLSKKIVVRGKVGHSSRGKKAYVYLKKGDKIEFV